MGKKKSKSKDDIVEKDDAIETSKQKLHYVCKPITSKSGILKQGECVRENDLAGGKDALDRLLKKGIVELR